MLRRFLPYMESIFVVLICAASPPLIKILLEDLSPYDIASIRYIVAFLLFLPLPFFFSRGNLRSLNTRDWLRLSIMGFAGFAILLISPMQTFPPRSTWGIMLWLIVPSSMLAFLIWNHARQKLKAFEMSIAVNLMPMGTALISPWLIGETIPGRAWIGMLVTLVGVLLVGFAGERTSERVIPERPL